MSKLTKPEIRIHDKACELLALSRDLTYDERLYVLDNWQESAQHVNSRSGAFFTPSSLARDLSVYTPDGGTLLDLCAGIGTLAFHCLSNTPHTRLTCVEVNPDYVEVGRKVVPEAEWVCADVFDLPEDIRRTDWDCVVCNPPFGKSKSVPMSGVTFDLNVLAVAVRLSQYGVFFLPQMSCPFVYSGCSGYNRRPSRAWEQFNAKCGGHNVAGLDKIDLMCLSIDCGQYKNEWRGVTPNVEMVMYDLYEQRLQEHGKGRPVAVQAFNTPRTPAMVDKMYQYRCNRCYKPMRATTCGEGGCNSGACECGGLIEAVLKTELTTALTDAEVSQYMQEIEELRVQGDDETADAIGEWLGQALGFEDSEDTKTEDIAPPTESPIHPLHTSSPVIDTAALAALFEE